MNKVEEIQSFCKENGVRMIDFKTVDLAGRWHHITIPVERFCEDTLIYGIGFDGSNFGYASVEKSDMVFLPDVESAHLDPFVAVPTLSMTGDVKTIGKTENLRFGQYARSVTERAEEYMRETGIADKMVVGPEFEFYLFDRVSFETAPNHASYSVDTRPSGTPATRTATVIRSRTMRAITPRCRRTSPSTCAMRCASKWLTGMSRLSITTTKWAARDSWRSRSSRRA